MKIFMSDKFLMEFGNSVHLAMQQISYHFDFARINGESCLQPESLFAATQKRQSSRFSK